MSRRTLSTRAKSLLAVVVTASALVITGCCSSSGSGSNGDVGADADAGGDVGVDGPDAAGACGDGVLDPGEACDGQQLGDNSCVAEGFDGGQLGCTDQCELDVSACVRDTCGNGVLDPAEDCDGTLLDGTDCPTLGADGGELGCTSNCMFEDSACTYTCGNDAIGGDEVCDGDNLAGRTCVDEGFDGGVLGCEQDCSAFDPSECLTAECGDDVCELSEDESSCPTDCVTTAPALGDVVFVELMLRSRGRPAHLGQWVELYNTSGAPVQLRGCRLYDNSGAVEHLFGESAVIPAGEVFTVASSDDPGFVPDAVGRHLHFLHDGRDGLSLRCGPEFIDAVSWDGGPEFPRVEGASLQLPLALTDVEANDEGDSWCVASTASDNFASGDLGSPGRINPDCGPGPIETCDDVLDNDFDTLVDCADPDCSDDAVCAELNCNDGVDNEPDGARDCADVDCVFHAGCRAWPAPQAGDVIIAEVMIDPLAISTFDGQWIELLNTTDETLDLEGCVLTSMRDTVTTIGHSVPVEAGEAVLAARDEYPGVQRDIHFPAILAQTDGVTLVCNETEVDTVSWDRETFPIARGASMQLNPTSFDADANDDGDNWCHTNSASANFQAGDFGNPGIANPPCPVLPAEDCGDELDNDVDGYVDCADIQDCRGAPSCEEVCDDGEDNDFDQDTDCYDEDCAGQPPCGDEVCTDGIDNDANTAIDCADPVCSSASVCGDESCGDSFDNDGDRKTDCADEDCFFDPFCRVGDPPGVGDVVVTEVMIDPVARSRNRGRWVELRNVGTSQVDLLGCELIGFSARVIPSNVAMAPGAVATIAASDQPGFVPDATTTSLSLSSSSGVVLSCDGVEVDAVLWDQDTFPIVSGASMQLEPTSTNATDNDDGGAWCATNVAIGFEGGDLGNPGSTNPPCATSSMETCDNGADDDLDQRADCVDSDCFLDSACRSFPHPGVGEVIFTELMAEPAFAFDDWIEVQNVGVSTVDLLGCELVDDNGSTVRGSIETPAEIEPGEVLTIATMSNPGFVPDIVTSITFGVPTDGGFILRCNGTDVDTAVWSPSTHPVVPGSSMQLDPNLLDAGSNDDGANWCRNVSVGAGFLTGDNGNPGEVNPPCPIVPGESCDDLVDNDLDGTTDCADSDCLGSFVCGTERCSDGFDNDGDGALDCRDEDCFLSDDCRFGPLPTAGTLVITELMLMPGNESTRRQWFEVENVSDSDVDLLGCEVTADFIFDFTVDRPFVASPGDVVTFTAGPSPGFAADFSFFFELRDSGTRVSIRCGGELVDQVDTDDDFPAVPGASTQLSPGSFDAAENDDSAAWCTTNAASITFFSGDLGNPGVSNPPCPAAAAELCDNRIDDDLDGLVDCADVEDCAGMPHCAEACTDRRDEDGDGAIDCEDSDCDRALPCLELECLNRFDDDGNGFTDCEDFTCLYDSVTRPCGPSDEESGPIACTDEVDNDNDGFTDCEDFSCSFDVNYSFCQ